MVFLPQLNQFLRSSMDVLHAVQDKIKNQRLMYVFPVVNDIISIIKHYECCVNQGTSNESSTQGMAEERDCCGPNWKHVLWGPTFTAKVH